jgi:hypothetical protein
MQRPSHNQPHRTYSKDVLGEDQFGFRRGKGTRDAIGMLRIISKLNLVIDEALCACFKDWQKAFDRVMRKKIEQQWVHGSEC